VAAFGTSVARTSSAVYDFYTGLVTTATDVDNQVSTITEYDILGRPIKVRTAANSALESWTRTEYSDSNRRIIVRSDIDAIGDGKSVAIQHFDQLGRVRLSRTLENSATEDPYNEQHGIKVETRYQTGNPNSYQLTSNPFRAATATAATNEPTMGWTRSTALNTGRHSEVETFSGASLPTPWGTNANSTGVVATDIDADRTLVTDQAGKQRISKTNALGQLSDVWEITASDQWTEALTFGSPAVNLNGYKTRYVYDELNNLKTVNQGVQTRSFSYSSLSRLLSATNPESGAIQYQYDANGNLTSKTDARSITTSYVYDALSRVTNRNYSDNTTPNVTYTYDNVQNAKGKLTKVSSAFSTTEYTAFDILGRVMGHKQTTDGTDYTTGYVYNLSGALIEETYPSGRVVKHVLDNNGDLSAVVSSPRVSTGFMTYAHHFTYNAAGAVTSMQLGNGRWESTVFNSRLQPAQIALGTVQSGTDKLKLNYDYGTTQNSGNVVSQTITVPTETRGGTTYNGFAATQVYAYDPLNRLKSGEETIPSQTGWKQTFVYDRYGNRRFDTTGTNTTTIESSCSEAVCNPQIDPANNKLIGTEFDNAGNTKTDAENKTFVYDAENKQVEVKNSANQTIGQYFYDGDGKRVKKWVPSTGETTIFVYDASGKLVAEYSTQIASSQDAKVSYLTNDHLGSPRINTDATGTVTARHDYRPFGDEIERASYGVDQTRKQFTGYERDIESDLDFAEARYYNKNHGRFTSVDPLLSTGSIYNPQTWNRYSYTLNSPLKYTDPSGMYICDGDKKQCKNIEEGIKIAQNALKKLDSKSDQYKDLDRALKTYGAAGVDNGLTIKFGATVTGAPAETSGVIRDRDQDGKKDITADNPTGRDLVITFDTKQFGSASDYAGTIGHEGSHVADRTDFIGALPLDLASDAATKMFESSPLNSTKYDTESRAYGVSASVARGQGVDSLTVGRAKHEIWNSGWREADRMKKQTEGINKVLAEPKSKGGLYEVTKENPGPRLY
jgi:RHS repeat-associated protein